MERTLSQKYNVPISHLDFGYIASCEDAREMEKIVLILRSGEEGHYPDLTRTAEAKLQQLHPTSRYLRNECEVRRRLDIPSNEWGSIYHWNNQIRNRDNILAALRNRNADDINEDFQYPPVRFNAGCINFREPRNPLTSQSNNNGEFGHRRTRVTDYRLWDKYNVDEELLRIELSEERVREEVERKNQINLEKSLVSPNIMEIQKLEADHSKQLNDIEREHLCEEYRLKGNEYFRVKDYQHAIQQYTRSISVNPENATITYTNRATAYFKLKNYVACIADCDESLKIDPNYVKAYLRKADALNGSGKTREAYDLYMHALDLEPNNEFARHASSVIRQNLNLPPPEATRLTIEEDKPSTSNKSKPPQPVNADNDNNNQSTVALANAAIGNVKKLVMEYSKLNIDNNGNAVAATSTSKSAKTEEGDWSQLVLPNRVTSNIQNARNMLDKLMPKVKQISAAGELTELCAPNAEPPNLPTANVERQLIQEI